MEINRRKGNRIPGYNYSEAGAYFCTLDRKPILSKILVGTGLPDCPNHPNLMLSAYGKTAEKYIKQLDEFYHHISVDKYIIMPDHVVRNQQDYNEIWEYIANNPRKWMIMHAKDQGNDPGLLLLIGTAVKICLLTLYLAVVSSIF